jgi:uncharacterized repeat protein (TIGR01451 family)
MDMTTLLRRTGSLVAVLLLLAAAAFGTTFVSDARAVDPPPNLTIDKVILESPPYAVGQEVSYVLVVTNNGGDMPAGSSVVARDLLPAKVDLLEASEAARAEVPFFLGVTCSSVQRLVTCELPQPLVAGDHFVVRVRVDLTAPGHALNLAWTRGVNSPEGNWFDNLDFLHIQVQ